MTMNWKRGFRRLTQLPAVIGAVCSFFVGGEIAENIGANIFGQFAVAFLSMPVGYCLIWFIYYLIEWFVLGFVEGKPKDKEK